MNDEKATNNPDTPEIEVTSLTVGEETDSTQPEAENLPGKLEAKAKETFEKNIPAAEKLLKNEDKVERLLKRLESKLKSIGTVGDALAYLPAMGLLINSYVKKEYTDIPIGTIAGVVVAVAYFVSPIDLIPDFIPIAGFTDDAAVVALALALAKKDIDEYLAWRKEKGLD